VRTITSRMALWCRSRSILQMKREDQYFPLLTDDVFAIYPSSFFHFRLQEVTFGPLRLLMTSPMIPTMESRRPTGCYTNFHQSHQRSGAIFTPPTQRHHSPSKASKHGSLQEFFLRHQAPSHIDQINHRTCNVATLPCHIRTSPGSLI
jgi:hypothetical protein